MPPLLEEEEKYVRLALLLKEVAPRAVRSYFDKSFPPTYLPSTLNSNYNKLDDLKFRRVLNQTQWNLLFPTNGMFIMTGIPDYNSFDVTGAFQYKAFVTCLLHSNTYDFLNVIMSTLFKYF